MPRRSQLIPWKAAGRVTERYATGDEVVRETGWVFNNAVGEQLTLAEFVATGDEEVPPYLALFGLKPEPSDQTTIVEIGSGIGRMTCALTHNFGCVIAGDLDAGFLERCRETVAQFGKIDRLRTLEMADGRSLDLPDDSVDVAFSYITLQHCEHDDALALAAEAVRVTRPGGRIALNLRSRSTADIVVRPLGALMRTLFGVPLLGSWLSHRRFATRLAWQANRLEPHELLARVGEHLDDIVIWQHPQGKLSSGGAATSTYIGINEHHWWLAATVRDT